jgi:ATP/maltotriose-dependent transcriptional regulator MalT
MIPIFKLHISSPVTEDTVSADHGLKSTQPGDRVGESLTARECDILGLISQGFSNKSIARMLKISPETVKSHVKHIFLKLAVSTRAAAVARATLGAFDVQRQYQEQPDRTIPEAAQLSFRN